MDTLEAKGGHSTKWEELRKQARHIEQDLDVKLVSFSKLGSISHGSASQNAYNTNASSDRNALIDFQDHDSVHSSHSHHTTSSQTQGGQTGSDDMFKTMSIEIQSLLGRNFENFSFFSHLILKCFHFFKLSPERLRNINEQLADFSQKNSPNGMNGGSVGVMSGNAAMVHTLQRHRDILQDFQHEFNKIKSNIETQREREDLLGSVRRDIDLHYRQVQQRQRGQGMDGGDDGPGAADYFMDEQRKLLRRSLHLQRLRRIFTRYQ